VYAPSAALADAVEGIWFAEGTVDHEREVVLPNGAVELIVNIGAPQWVFGDALHPERRYDRAWLAGVQRGPLVIGDGGHGTRLVGVRFRPGGLSAWLGVPLCELTDRVLEIDELSWRWPAGSLRERLAAAEEPDARLALIDAALLEQRRGSVDPRVALALGELGRAHAERRLRVLAERLGTSQQTLIALFHRTVGVSPRKLARILRFHGVVEALRGERRVAWAALAAEHGFSDQAHLAREVREFAGVSPRTLFASRTSDGYHVLG
jgi:AraC-like DNA-binding protein